MPLCLPTRCALSPLLIDTCVATDGCVYSPSMSNLNTPISVTACPTIATNTQMTRPNTLGGNLWGLLSSPVQSPLPTTKHSHNSYQSPASLQQPAQLNRALSTGASIKAMFLPLSPGLGGLPPPPPPPPPTPSSPQASQPTTPTTPAHGAVLRGKKGTKIKGDVAMGEVVSQPNLTAAFRAGLCISKNLCRLQREGCGQGFSLNLLCCSIHLTLCAFLCFIPILVQLLSTSLLEVLDQFMAKLKNSKSLRLKYLGLEYMHC